MLTDVSIFLRNKIKEQLKWCTVKQRQVFKRMYSPDNPQLDINIVVDNMPDSKLEWAYGQICNTLRRR